MKKIFMLFFTVFSIQSAVVAADIEYIDKSTAVVRVMNKSAGKAEVATLPVGKTVSYEKLLLKVRNCKATGPYSAEDFFMFIEIDKNSNAREERIFSGWMGRNNPGANPLQDADYDVWLVGCE